MKISIITLFPNMIRGFMEESILNKAQEKEAVEIELINLRDFAIDTYGTVDNKAYGGGPGMVLMAEPLSKAIKSANNSNLAMNQLKSKVLLTSAKGKTWNQTLAQEYSKLEHLVIIAGHYEGVDERIVQKVDEEISLGNFIMTGGEIAAVAMVDSIVRLLPGVLEKEGAKEEESFFAVSVEELKSVLSHDEMKEICPNVHNVQLLEYPHYTRPEEWEGEKVPEVLLSGNHAKIRKWRLRRAFEMTKKLRPDLLSVDK